ncbi:MAG: DUF4147 domain-containing protein [Patescibacteria group bacterium]
MEKNYPIKLLKQLAQATLRALQPEQMVKVNLPKLGVYKHIYVIGAGKATFGMAVQINKMLGKKITAGYINVPGNSQQAIGKIIVQTGSHPFPDQNTVQASNNILKLVRSAGKNDLVIGLWSGGGSSLFTIPRAGITLPQQVELTKKLMRAGADIIELNTVRKHISQVKGGQLAAVCSAAMLNLIISDVIGDPLDVIASGPTVADASTTKQARQILKKYHIYNKPLEKIILLETPKKINSKKVKNILIGSNKIALNYLVKLAKQKQITPVIITDRLSGEARIVAKRLCRYAKKIQAIKQLPVLLLAGGETTVTVKGNGYGGRNQELVLAALPHLAPGISLLSLATDGVDGFTPKPVAAAFGTFIGGKDAINRVFTTNKFLDNHDSYTILNKLHQLLFTGPTGTNVGDIVLLLVEKPPVL